MDDLDRLLGDRPPRGRRAADGTNWCLCCDTVIGQGRLAAFCPDHVRLRNTYRRASRRAAVAATERMYVPMRDIDEVVKRTDELLAALGLATTHFRAKKQPAWVDDLMLIAKDLALAVETGLRPLSAYARVSMREMRVHSSDDD